MTVTGGIEGRGIIRIQFRNVIYLFFKFKPKCLISVFKSGGLREKRAVATGNVGNCVSTGWNTP